MTVEQLLTEALHRADQYAPSPDLFARVERSIEEATAHRRRLRIVSAWLAALLLASAAWVAAFLDVSGGTVTMPWWTVEALTVVLLLVIVVALGPLLRRYGTVFAADVFGSNPATSERFLAVLDIAYYLVFGAYIIMTTAFAADPDWDGSLVDQVEGELVRIGLLLLIMGVLHAITIATLPVMGLVFASSWWRAVRAELGDDAGEPDPEARQADRVATVIVWVLAGLAAFQAIGFLAGPLLGLLLGAD